MPEERRTDVGAAVSGRVMMTLAEAVGDVAGGVLGPGVGGFGAGREGEAGRGCCCPAGGCCCRGNGVGDQVAADTELSVAVRPETATVSDGGCCRQGEGADGRGGGVRQGDDDCGPSGLLIRCRRRLWPRRRRFCCRHGCEGEAGRSCCCPAGGCCCRGATALSVIR